MLSRNNRLTNKNDFERVQKEGKVNQFESFGISFFFRNDQEDSRFGFVISTKISKESTQRNRIKRAFREAVRHSISSLKKGIDIVFLAKKGIIRKSTEEIMREVKNALAESGLIS